ncbi:MAG: integrating conjugative element protein [Gammaproteobacteria bacterium]
MKLSTITMTLLLSWSTCVLANDIIPIQSHYYYQLGGGSDVVIPPVKNNIQLTIGGDVNTNLGFNCSSFNPAVSITNSLNNLTDTVEGLPQDIISSATVAIGSTAMYALEKSSPDLYNLTQNGILSGQETFNLSMKSCQQAHAEIAKGESPYQDWFAISDSQGWLKSANQAQQGQSVDINATYQDNAQHNMEYGVPWVHKGQNSGGTQSGQVPIKVINDVVVAGYNILVDPTRPLDSNEAPAKGEDDYLTSYWPLPDDAGKWATMVLGDMTITAQSNESAQSTVAGVGLSTLMTTCPAIGNYQKTCVKDIQQNIEGLVTSDTAATPDELRAISASNLVITQQVIDAIKNQDSESQAISINRLAQDVATQNLAEEGLLLRRVLTAGSQAQAVLNVKPAQDNIQKALQQLNNDLNDLMFEHQIRQQMMTNSLQTVLANESAKEAQAINHAGQTGELPMTNGAVYDSK